MEYIFNMVNSINFVSSPGLVCVTLILSCFVGFYYYRGICQKDYPFKGRPLLYIPETIVCKDINTQRHLNCMKDMYACIECILK